MERERVFYIKEVAGGITLTHLPTHAFINSYSSKQEVAQAIKEWGEKGERELWEFLMNQRAVKIPRKNSSYLSKKSNEDKEGEAHWYKTVWKKQTDQFYEVFPEVEIVTENPIPRELIQEIRKEKSQKFDAVLEQTKEESKPEPKKIIRRKPEAEEKPGKKKIIRPKKKPEQKKDEPKKKRPKLKRKIKAIDSVDPF